MRLPKFSKKVIAVGAAVGLAMGVAGVAAAHFTSTGTGNGSATTGTATSWTVSSIDVGSTLLYPGAGSAAVSSDTVKNVGHGTQGVAALTVTITHVTQTGGYTTDGTCGATNYELASTGSWTSSGANATTATITYSSAITVAPTHFLVGGATSSSTGNALPSGLSVEMVNKSGTQDACEGATVTLKLHVS